MGARKREISGPTFFIQDIDEGHPLSPDSIHLGLGLEQAIVGFYEPGHRRFVVPSEFIKPPSHLGTALHRLVQSLDGAGVLAEKLFSGRAHSGTYWV